MLEHGRTLVEGDTGCCVRHCHFSASRYPTEAVVQFRRYVLKTVGHPVSIPSYVGVQTYLITWGGDDQCCEYSVVILDQETRSEVGIIPREGPGIRVVYVTVDDSLFYQAVA